ncbi:hypothetical protein BHE90_000729 [Fusarium euwallaceae]|uniref:Uncharacterized protein n=1 Tax=Fusarium euwallaceae TaxID=1147111 RepID=A0A430M9J1_9HYPO|nr:hypothetical protein BHE90_000729 [Fusarium euwallaceae]
MTAHDLPHDDEPKHGISECFQGQPRSQDKQSLWNSTPRTISARSYPIMLLSTYLTVPFLLVAQASVRNAISVDFTVWKNSHACQGKESLSGRVDSFGPGGLSGGGFIPDLAEFLFYEKANCKGKLRDRHPKYYDSATQSIGVGFRSFEIL